MCNKRFTIVHNVGGLSCDWRSTVKYKLASGALCQFIICMCVFPPRGATVLRSVRTQIGQYTDFPSVFYFMYQTIFVG